MRVLSVFRGRLVTLRQEDVYFLQSDSIWRYIRLLRCKVAKSKWSISLKKNQTSESHTHQS
jgi:hypothetical protein